MPMTGKPMTFKTELAGLKPDAEYSGIHLPEGFYGSAKMGYGALFAYLFRRFGYPDTGWDDDKQLVKYYLATPEPDMVLAAHPSGGECRAVRV